jgi:hypothetical protein
VGVEEGLLHVFVYVGASLNRATVEYEPGGPGEVLVCSQWASGTPISQTSVWGDFDSKEATMKRNTVWHAQ